MLKNRARMKNNDLLKVVALEKHINSLRVFCKRGGVKKRLNKAKQPNAKNCNIQNEQNKLELDPQSGKKL